MSVEAFLDGGKRSMPRPCRDHHDLLAEVEVLRGASRGRSVDIPNDTVLIIIKVLFAVGFLCGVLTILAASSSLLTLSG